MYWLKAAYNDGYSFMFSICSGVRQGTVLSPLLFALFIHDISQLCDPRNPCCVVIMIYSGVQVMSSPARRSVLMWMISSVSAVSTRHHLHSAGQGDHIRFRPTSSRQWSWSVHSTLSATCWWICITYYSISTPTSDYQIAWFISFFYICMNPFIYATKFDPVRRVLVNLIPCMKTPVQPTETVEVAASSKTTRPTQSRKWPVQHGMDTTNIFAWHVHKASDCCKLWLI